MCRRVKQLASTMTIPTGLLYYEPHSYASQTASALFFFSFMTSSESMTACFFFFLFYTDAQCLRSTKNIVRQALQQANLVSFFEQASGVFTLLQSAGPVGSTC